ncbi:MAG: hypothetical protein CM1200mP40_12380 [Gammaproteobacteria bacterium]|nr:MAG: hypothetical protein CM1200mP40_12380 [Gammaproteobacteria bacterium]
MKFGIMKLPGKNPKEFDPQGGDFFWGPESANPKSRLKQNSHVYNYGVPILGICYGMQIMAEKFGEKLKLPLNQNSVLLR